MNKAAINIPKKSLKDFCQRHQVQRLALFGSVLRDDFRPESDVDVLVVFNLSAKVTFLTLGSMKGELSSIFNRSVDLVPQDGLKAIIREEVLSNALEVYAT